MPFRSGQARDRFLTAQARLFDRRWPRPWHNLDVTTRFGRTRAVRSGPAEGVPFVLLPGAGGNALMWHPHIHALSRDRPVYALDPVGEPGASTQDAPIRDGGDWSAWLGSVLDGLGVDRAHLIGCSYGGWIALRHELDSPGRAATLTLLDPAGFGRVSGRFLAWVILGGLAGLTPRPVRRFAARPLHNATLLDDDLMGMLRLAMAFRRRLPVPGVFTDDELRRIAAPTLALLGARSQLYDAREVGDRIAALLPHARVEIVADAGHDLPMHSPELIAERARALALTGSPADGEQPNRDRRSG
jgi:pimeloyl-ACP methyl ester carboxylesterase